MTAHKQIEERCTGHCCRCFWLPYSPEFMKKEGSKFQDGEMIVDMIIPVYWVESKAAFDKHQVTPGVSFYTYTCRHHQLNGDCAVYERRPKMCWDFPYGQPCPIEGCTMKPPVKQIEENPKED